MTVTSTEKVDSFSLLDSMPGRGRGKQICKEVIYQSCSLSLKRIQTVVQLGSLSLAKLGQLDSPF